MDPACNLSPKRMLAERVLKVYIVCSCQPELQRKARSQKRKENQTGLETYRRVCHPLLWPVVSTSVCVGLRIRFTTGSVLGSTGFSSYFLSFFLTPPFFLRFLCWKEGCLCPCQLTLTSLSFTLLVQNLPRQAFHLPMPSNRSLLFWKNHRFRQTEQMKT